MKMLHWSLAVAATAFCYPPTGYASPVKTGINDTCKHGTAVEFVATPSLAAAQAKAEQKLVFVLHLSGLFEDPAFT